MADVDIEAAVAALKEVRDHVDKTFNPEAEVTNHLNGLLDQLESALGVEEALEASTGTEETPPADEQQTSA